MGLIEEILFRPTERDPQKVAVRDAVRSTTYSELTESVLRVSRRLRAAGLSKGARCLLVLPNSIEFLQLHFGIIRAGGISVPCEAHVAPQFFESVLDNSQPEFVVLTNAHFSRLSLVLKNRDLKVLSIDSSLPELTLEGGQAPQLLRDLTEEAEVFNTVDSDLAALMYTTGSTGRPKGVQLTHSNILSAVKNICGFIQYTSDDLEVVTLPLSHSFGLGHAYCNLRSGASIVLENGLLRAKRVLDALEIYKATGFPGTPLGISILLDRYSEIFREKGRYLRFMVVNSAALPPERAQQLQSLFPKTKILVYYGLTEASRSCFISLTDEGPSYFRSVGRSMPGIEIAIEKEGQLLPAGSTGEVVISGPTVTSGYWNQPEATKEALRGGRLSTGDLGRVDARGFLFLEGRIKDLINVGGYKVNPQEVENLLAKYPGVLDCGVAGLTRTEEDEIVAAGVVVDPRVSFDPIDCERFCTSALERYKVPQKFMSVSQIPRAESGKLKRQELRQLLQERWS